MNYEFDENELISKLQNGLTNCPNCNAELQFYYRETNRMEYATCPNKCFVSFGYNQRETIVPRNEKGQFINQGKTENTVVKRITKKEWTVLLINHAIAGEEIKKTDLEYLIGVKLEILKKFTCYQFYPIINKDGEIINFIDIDQYFLNETKNYDFNDLEFDKTLDCYILN